MNVLFLNALFILILFKLNSFKREMERRTDSLGDDVFSLLTAAQSESQRKEFNKRKYKTKKRYNNRIAKKHNS